MYDLSGCYDNTLSVMKYTVNAMRETGYSQREIEDYMEEATKSNNAHLVNVSTDYICKCNELCHAYDVASDEYFNYNDDYYYDSSLWQD